MPNKKKSRESILQHRVFDFSRQLKPRQKQSKSENLKRVECKQESRSIAKSKKLAKGKPEQHKSSRGTQSHMTPGEVKKRFKGLLNQFEQQELERYKTIYYIGPDKLGRQEPFDDERGEYLWAKDQHIAYRYQVLGALGRGSFGQVLLAKDHKSKEKVALKIIRNRRKLSEQAMTQVRILSFIKEADQQNLANIVQLKDFFVFRNHVCLAFELLQRNLYQLVQEGGFKGLGAREVKGFTLQLLFSLSFLYSKGIIHTDLKPENILLAKKGRLQVKLIDFGSSCFSQQRIYTYIQSRYYRAPEIVLELPYSTQIDVWSLGCIVAQLILGYPLFPAETEAELLALIYSSIGPPPQHFLAQAPRRSKFFNTRNELRFDFTEVHRLRKLRHMFQPLQSVFQDTELVNFLQQALRWQPERRRLPRDCLLHQWVLGALSPPQIDPHIQFVRKQFHNSNNDP